MATSYARSMVALPKITSPTDNVSTEHPTLQRYIDKNETQDGGTNWSPTRYATADSAGGYFEGDVTTAVLTTAQGNNILNEVFSWAHVCNPITVTHADLIQTGNSKLVKVAALESKRFSAQKRHDVLLAAGFINGDGTSNVPQGLADLVNPSDTYGTVVPGTDADWTPKTETSATVLSGSSIIESMINKCSFDGKTPTLGPTTRDLFNRCAAIYGQGLTYNAAANGEQTLGMSKMFVRGGKSGKPLEIYWDDDIAASSFYVLNEGDIHLIKSSVCFRETRNPDLVNSALNQYTIKNGMVISSYITGAETRRLHGGWTNLSA